MKRRSALKMLSTGVVSIALPQEVLAKLGKINRVVRLGVITDLHHDIMHDGHKRLATFLEEMKKLRPDAILQMGDFAIPKKESQGLVDDFNRAHDTVMHVIGNHDTDLGYSTEQVLKAWGIENRYYHKDVDGLRFFVLDGNDKGSPTHKGGYANYVGSEQLEWLETGLKQYDGPCVIISHQPLGGPDAVDNAADIQKILSSHKDKVVIAINGHTHIDYVVKLGGIHYLHINSASYYWVGGKYRHESYSKKVHAQHLHLASTCPYKDAVFTTLEFDSHSGVVKVGGKMSEWVGKSPQQLDPSKAAKNGEDDMIVPGVRRRVVSKV
ncbi:3',5'-cyclic adenosine monophosphate phosphodiesterase CpdA [Rubritalea halochordaticola]|uniref:3',5'-cyclic adenosine monophosphate phosphodiesterase CpdA n=1 Tax=Rubritalea halochordaticola TaxID=714537 RepID=A0ABP9V9T6_9BACT